MSTTVIEPGRLVRVDPDVLNADDILEFGAALIEEHGHVTGDSGDVDQGFSIHGAIGEAASRATGDSGKNSDRARTLRDAAAEKIRARHMPTAASGNQAEYEVNDNAPAPAAAVDAMLAARGA